MKNGFCAVERNKKLNQEKKLNYTATQVASPESSFHFLISMFTPFFLSLSLPFHFLFSYFSMQNLGDDQTN